MKIAVHIEDGRACPFIFCAACDKRITAAADAIVVFEHRSGCEYDAYHKGQCDPGSESWDDLGDWLAWLASNSGAAKVTDDGEAIRLELGPTRGLI